MPEGPLQIGTQIMEVRRIMGRQVKSYYEVVEYEPYSRYVGKMLNGTMARTGTCSFTSTPEGTGVNWTLKFVQEGFTVFLVPIFGRVLKMTLDKDLAKANSLLESGIEVG